MALTPDPQYGPHDLSPQEMSPLNLGASGIPHPHHRSKETLPSLHSLHLITPPHSANMPKENSFSSVDLDRHSDHFGHLNPASEAPLFMEPNPSSNEVGPPLSWEALIANHDSPYERYYQDGQIDRPSRHEYRLSLEFYGEFHREGRVFGSENEESPMQKTEQRSPRKEFGSVLSPNVTRLPQSSIKNSPWNEEVNHTGFRSVNDDMTSPRPVKRARISSSRSNRISETPIRMHRHESEEFMTESPPKRSTKKRNSTGSASGNREPKHARNKSTKVKRPTDHNEYPDYTPSFEAMNNPMHYCMKVRQLDVKNPVDLDTDPLRDELHETELIAAKHLNINASVYLCTKRQIFQGFVEHLRGNKQGNWNKTAAQNVVNLDVTKASALWQFYNDIGWFERNLFTQFLDKSSPEA